MEKLTLELTLEQVNLILQIIGQRPFVEVAELITLIQQQSQKQLQPQPPLPLEE